MTNTLKFDEIMLAGSGLKPHDIIAHIPRWEDNDARFLALRRFVQDGGELDAIKITPSREIIDADSRERWRVAAVLKLENISVQIIAEEDAEIVSIGTLVNRRHLTKSALAYLTYSMMKPAFEASRSKRLENLKNANVSRKSTEWTIGNTVDEFAEHIGISRALFFEAKKVHEIFAKDAEYKAAMEPRILAEPIGGEHEEKRPVGLGAVIAGYAGRGATADKAKGDRGQLKLFTESVSGLFKRFDYWTGMGEQDRRAALKTIREDMDTLAPEKCAEVAELLRSIASELSARAKGAK